MADNASCEFVQAVLTVTFYAVSKAGVLLLYLLCLSYMFIIPLMLITIGNSYKDLCPAEPKLPIYIIIYGIFQSIHHLFCHPRLIIKPKKYKFIISALLMIMYTIGSLRVLTMYPANFVDFDAPDYCHEVLYKSTLFHIIVSYSWLALKGLFCTCYNADTVQ